MNENDYKLQSNQRRALYNKVSDLITSIQIEEDSSSPTFNLNASKTEKSFASNRMGGIVPCKNGYNFCLYVLKLNGNIY